MTKTSYTAHDIYKLALALLAEKEARAKDYNVFYPVLLNVVMVECFNANNAIRARDGLERLKKSEMPYVEDEEKEDFIIPYDEKLIREVMAFGLAAYLVLDDDKAISAAFSQQYEARLSRYEGGAVDVTQIKDVY